ncbi:MAG: alanine--tRNA ligase [Spartobacteria bacterium AMD-G4]|nr:MAG: alanine--tRNA ligase [Spartobacteria bacterium AMD-G4]
MTSAQIRQSFLDFFREKQHTIVPSSSLMPDSPNLLFTNAGMNQFVPFFLGQKAPDVSKWAGALPSSDLRAADTQKCIRAGGKHNDLDDVGLDTYHHTMFEMLGNWSFGDYFKKEAIDWAWELVIGRWKFPPARLYATIYNPEPGDPASRDEEAWEIWAEKFRSVGLDPAVHIVNGNKKDNFWMMGETGPCGPCSELHVDLTPAGDTGGALVNKGSADCIEIWNLVFIQFNANPDGSFSPLPACHVDTGMGFERVASIIQGTKNLTDFANARISNYETDIFRPIFDELEKLSGQTYGSTLPVSGSTGDTEQEKNDVAFRVIADHIRTLTFAIGDGIQPGNTDRNYVLRRILRRAVRYGRSLGFRAPFFHKLVDVLARTMGDVFPEIRTKQKHIEDILKLEEESFNKTLDKGIALFNEAAAQGNITGAFAFKLYDEQGFPLDLTELMARERGLTVDTEGFNTLMEGQRARARAAQKKQVITLSEIETTTPTVFTGYESLTVTARVLEVLTIKDRTAVILDRTPCYAEMGGQVGDTAEITRGGQLWRVANTQKTGNTWLHLLDSADAPNVGDEVQVSVNATRRAAIQRHHTVTHLLHWALHEVVSPEATQKGSSVSPEKLTFDFNSAALTAQQVREIENLVNERILENASVSWTEVPYAEVRGRADIMQFFGDKYGDTVRVVQVGGTGNLDGYSMELCAGTHTRATGEIGLFRILAESAIAAGVRRIEAIAGLEASALASQETQRLHEIARLLNSPAAEIEKKLEALLAHQKELEKALKAARSKEAAASAKDLAAKAESLGGIPFLSANLGAVDGDYLQAVLDALKPNFEGVTVLAGSANNAVSLAASVSPAFTSKIQAGKIIQSIAPIVGGKGGGKPDMARGGGKDTTQIPEALAAAQALLGAG